MATIKGTSPLLQKVAKSTSPVKSISSTSTSTKSTSSSGSKSSARSSKLSSRKSSKTTSSNVTSALSMQQQINPLVYFQQPQESQAVVEKAKEAPKVFTTEGAKDWAYKELSKPETTPKPTVVKEPSLTTTQSNIPKPPSLTFDQEKPSGVSQSTWEAIQKSEYGKTVTPTLNVPIIGNASGTSTPEQLGVIVNPADRDNIAKETPFEYYAETNLEKTDSEAEYIKRKTPDLSKPKSILGGLTGGYLPGTEPPEKEYFVGRIPGTVPADFIGPEAPGTWRSTESKSIYLPKSQYLKDFDYMPDSSQHKQLLQDLEEQKKGVRDIQGTIFDNIKYIKDNPDVVDWELDTNNDGVPELIDRSEALKYYEDKKRQVNNYVSSIENQRSIIENISKLGYSVIPTNKGFEYKLPTEEEVYSHVYKDEPLPYYTQAFWSGDFGIRPAAVYASSKLLNKPEWWKAEDTRIKQYGLEGASMQSKTEKAGGQGWFPHLMQTGSSPTSQDIALYLGTAGLGFGVGQVARTAGSKTGTSTLRRLATWLSPKTSIGRGVSKVGGYALGGGIMVASEYPHLKEVYETNPDLLPGELASSGVKAFLGWRGFKRGMESGLKWDPTEFDPRYGGKELRTRGVSKVEVFPGEEDEFRQFFTYKQGGETETAAVRKGLKAKDKILQQFEPMKSTSIGEGVFAKKHLYYDPHLNQVLPLTPDDLEYVTKQGFRILPEGSSMVQGGGIGGKSTGGRLGVGGESSLKPFETQGVNINLKYANPDVENWFQSFSKVKYIRDPMIDDVAIRGLSYVDDTVFPVKGPRTITDPFTGAQINKPLKVQSSTFAGKSSPVPKGFDVSKVRSFSKTYVPDDEFLRIMNLRKTPYLGSGSIDDLSKTVWSSTDDISKIKTGRTPFLGGSSDDVSKSVMMSSDDLARTLSSSDDITKGVVSSSDDLARSLSQTDDIVTTKKPDMYKATAPIKATVGKGQQTVLIHQPEKFNPLARASIKSYFGQHLIPFTTSQSKTSLSLIPLGFGLGSYSGTVLEPKSRTYSMPVLGQVTTGQLEKPERKDLSIVTPVLGVEPTIDTSTRRSTDYLYGTVFDNVPTSTQTQDSATIPISGSLSDTFFVPPPTSINQHRLTTPGVVLPLPLPSVDQSSGMHYGFSRRPFYGRGYKEHKYQVKDMWTLSPLSKGKKKKNKQFFSIIK